MTLDEARDCFERDPGEMSASLYRDVAGEYYDDDMISGETYDDIANKTAAYLGDGR